MLTIYFSEKETEFVNNYNYKKWEEKILYFIRDNKDYVIYISYELPLMIITALISERKIKPKDIEIICSGITHYYDKDGIILDYKKDCCIPFIDSDIAIRVLKGRIEQHKRNKNENTKS